MVLHQPPQLDQIVGDVLSLADLGAVEVILDTNPDAPRLLAISTGNGETCWKSRTRCMMRGRGAAVDQATGISCAAEGSPSPVGETRSVGRRTKMSRSPVVKRVRPSVRR